MIRSGPPRYSLFLKVDCAIEHNIIIRIKSIIFTVSEIRQRLVHGERDGVTLVCSDESEPLLESRVRRTLWL